MYQSPKSISSSRYSNSEINDTSSRGELFSTLGSEKEINMVNFKHQQIIQPKKSKIVQTSQMRSRLVDQNYENCENKKASTNSSAQKALKAKGKLASQTGQSSSKQSANKNTKKLTYQIIKNE